MNVGLYFDLRNPPEWRQDPARLYGFTLEMCEEADALGCDSLWFSEHHLFDDGYLPQPLTMMAAAAARTSRARLGSAISIAPLHRPIELAEQTVIVDLVSNGRVDLGLGAGYRVPEFELYEAEFSSRYSTTDGVARELRRLWRSVVTPSPVQERIPIWMGYFGPQGARRAGLLGEGLLNTNPAMWPIYRDALLEGGHPVSAGRMAGGIQGWVAEDPDREWPEVATHLAHQFNSYRRYMVEGTGRPPPRSVDPDQLRTRDGAEVLGSVDFGEPAEICDSIIRRTAGAPVETVFFWASLSGMREKVVAEHVRRICGEVAGRLRDFDPSTAES
jgi:alkanesulfonate monooxygenase SsuD/methylene tetrahydromethanopterin reductase-like flavin-dependent oxidoreductase (luciferase family)